jgi:hypothetical protein
MERRRNISTGSLTQLATGRYDLFHSWSGDCLRSLQVAKRLGIPSIVEIPTWHRDGGKQKIHPDKPARQAMFRRLRGGKTGCCSSGSGL